MNIQTMLLPQPLPAVISIFLVFGIKAISVFLSKLFKTRMKDSLDDALWFFTTLAVVSLVFYLISVFQLAYLVVLRILSFTILCVGIVWLLAFLLKRRSGIANNIVPVFIRELGRKSIVMLIIPSALLIIYFLFSLSPAHTTDSLHYHLGVPLDIIRKHGIVNRPDWLHANLAGLGEQLNLMGLSAGTDVFGSLLQFTGIYYLLKVLYDKTVQPNNRGYILLSFISIPLIVTLLSTQKYQLLPAVCITIGLIGILTINERNHYYVILSNLLIFFAIGCKYSFALTGSVVLIIAFYTSIQRKYLKRYLFSVFTAGALLFFPLIIKNILFFKDPLFPFLSKFIADSPVIYSRFAGVLSNYKDSRLPFPANLILPDSIGKATTIIGLSVVNYYFLIKYRNTNRVKLSFLASVGSIILIALLGQKTSRFFLEPIMLMTVGMTFIEDDLGSSTNRLSYLFQIQMLCVLLFTLLEASLLIPGIFSNQMRDKALSKTAVDYNAMRWLNQTLPENAVFISPSWNLSFAKNEFISSDLFNYSNLEDMEEVKRILSFIESKKVEYIVVRKGFSPTTELNLFQEKYFSVFIKQSNIFTQATRNPFKTPPQYYWEIYSKQAVNSGKELN